MHDSVSRIPSRKFKTWCFVRDASIPDKSSGFNIGLNGSLKNKNRSVTDWKDGTLAMNCIFPKCTNFSIPNLAGQVIFQ